MKEVKRKEIMIDRTMKKIIKNMINIEIMRGHQKSTAEEKMRGTIIEESVLIEALTREIKSIGRVIVKIDYINMIGTKEIDNNLDQKKEMKIIIKEKRSQESQVQQLMKSKKYLKKSKEGDKN